MKKILGTFIIVLFVSLPITLIAVGLEGFWEMYLVTVGLCVAGCIAGLFLMIIAAIVEDLFEN